MKNFAKIVHNFLFKQIPIYYFKPRLRSLTWVITGLCNLDCIFCEAGRLLDNKIDTPLKRCFEIINEAYNLGIKTVHITGGEPFLRKDFFDILRYLKQKKIRVSVTTNGTLFAKMSEEKMDIIRNTIDNVFISLDSADKDRFDYIRGEKGTFELVLAGIKRLLSFSGINVIITAVITKENYSDIPSLIELSKELGITDINFQPVSPTARFKTDFVKDKDKFMVIDQNELENLNRTVHNAVKRIKDLNMKSNLNFLELYLIEYFNSFKENYNGLYLNNILKGHFKCIVPFYSLSIRHDGSVQCCAMLPSIGNIKNSSLKELWIASSETRRSLKKSEFFPICNKCFCQVNESLKFSILNSVPYNFRYLKYIFK